MKRILIIDDDPILIMLLSGILKKSGYAVITASDGNSGLQQASEGHPDLIITDYQMPDLSGLEVLAELKKRHPLIPVLMLTAHGDVSLTIKSIQQGAHDFIEKPINPKEILEAIASGLKTLEESYSPAEIITPKERKSIEDNLMVGKDAAMREIYKNVGRISLNKVNVMIQGETGTGKNRVARLIHYSGASREHPLMVINCSATSEEELTRDIFGAADARTKSGIREGKLNRAGLGTVVLNEVTRLPMPLQARLSEIIEKGAAVDNHRRTDFDQNQFFNARIIATTSNNIETMVQEGLFLKELYYQLCQFTIHLPPLRERKEDIPELVSHLLQQLNRNLDRKTDVIQEEVITLLQNHHWPGNIRELKNILTQAAVMAHGGVIQTKHIMLSRTVASKETTDQEPLLSLADIEKAHIEKVLIKNRWNKQETAALLGISRPTLNAKIEKYDLQP